MLSPAAQTEGFTLVELLLAVLLAALWQPLLGRPGMVIRPMQS